MRNCVLILCFGLFILGCSSNQEQNQENLDELIQQLEDIEWDEGDESYEDYDYETDYDIDVFTDPEVVEPLRERITDLLEKKRNSDRWEMTLGERYIRGEAEVRDEIVTVLQYGDASERSSLIWELDPYERPEFELTDSKIRAAVVDNLYDPDCESDAIEVMASQNFPNHLELFEKRLLSGDSQFEGEIVYRLGEEAKSLKALTYFESRLHADEITRGQLAKGLSGLALFRKNGDKEIQQKVDEICLYIYRHSKIENEDYESLSDDYGYGNPARELLEILFDYGGLEVRPIALKFLNYTGVADKAFACLVRLEGEKHRREIIDRMKYEDTYLSGLDLVSIFYENTGDRRMLQSAVTNFEYLYGRRDYNSYQLDMLVGELMEAVGDTAQTILEEHLEDHVIKEHALDLFEIRNMTHEDIGNYLLESGLILQPISPKKMAKSIEDSWGDDLYTTLDATDIYFWFNGDEIDAFFEYEYLLSYYKNSSQGNLSDLELAIDKSVDNELEYIAVFNDVGYTMWVGEREEWDYRIVGDFAYLINFILEENEVDRRFQVFNYDEYIFATDEQLERLKEKFRLEAYN